MVIEGTGSDEIAFRCLESAVGPFIRCNAHYLRRLPRLIDTLLERAEQNHARRQVEKRLMESEERYRDVFDNTSDLIQCVAPDGLITYTNRSWREAMGYTEQEARSLNLLDILHPDSMICCNDRFGRLLKGEALSCIEFKFVSRTGEIVHLMGDCGSIIKEGGVNGDTVSFKVAGNWASQTGSWSTGGNVLLNLGYMLRLIDSKIIPTRSGSRRSLPRIEGLRK